MFSGIRRRKHVSFLNDPTVHLLKMPFDLDVRDIQTTNATASHFAHNGLPEKPDQNEPAGYIAAVQVEAGVKTHTACDACRRKKLKCSGEATGCVRCKKQSLICHFSPQATMGRPRKRRKTFDDMEEAEPIESSSANIPLDHSDGSSTPSGIISDEQSSRAHSKTPAPSLRSATPGTSHEGKGLLAGVSESQKKSTNSLAQSKLEVIPLTYPHGLENWPDFSTMTSLPQVVLDNHPRPPSSSEQSNSLDSIDSSPWIRNILDPPACACLPNGYLTLSSISTLASFPVSVHTIETLQTAHRTAKSALYCSICPTKFSTGVLNTMLSGTLLTLLADNWHRVRTATASELRMGFSESKNDLSATNSSLTNNQSLKWRKFAHLLVRAHVYGDGTEPRPPRDEAEEDTEELASSEEQYVPRCRPITNTSASTPTLLDLIEAMERRQSMWHRNIPATGEFLERSRTTGLDNYTTCMKTKKTATAGEINDRDDEHLCLQIVQSAKSVIETLNTPCPTI